MEEKLYTINEFAKLCETPKSTLLVYDRKGLLKPTKIGENGYRYYLPEQFYEYYVIKALQMAGTSLSEIKELLKSGDNKNLPVLLRTKRAELSQRMFELMRMQQFVDNMLSQEELIEFYGEKLRIKEQPEEYFIAMPTGHKNYSPKEYGDCMDAITNLNKYIKERRYSDNILFDSGYIIEESRYSEESYTPTHYYCKISFKPDDNNLHIKPAGIYASYCVKGSYYDLPKHHEEFRRMLAERGYKIKGDCYISNINFSVLTFSENNVVRIISAKVE